MKRKREQNGIYGPEAGRPSSTKHARQVQKSQAATSESSAYLETKVMTASPAELRLMLIDGAIRFTEQARAALASRDHEAAFEGFSKARAIVTELIAGLNPDISPELCERLTKLYTFVFTRLVDAASTRSEETLDEVLQLLRYERDTWHMLVSNLTAENGSASMLEEAPNASPSHDPAAHDGHLPAAGRISTTG